MKKLATYLVLATIAFGCVGVDLALAQDPAPVVAVADVGAGLVPVEYIENPSAFEIVKHAPAFVLQMIPFMLGIMAALRGLSEGLLLVGDKTKTGWESGAGQIIGTVVAMLGQILGHFGIGMPKTMILAKAEAHALKDATPPATGAPGGGPNAAA